MLSKLFLCSVTQLFLAVTAGSNCSPREESTITRFNSIDEDFELSIRDPNSLANYTDRQLGIFRFANLNGHRNSAIRFNLNPLTAKISMLSSYCPGEPQCVVALVVPNPGNSPDLLTKTLLADDLKVDAPRFEAFDNNWTTIHVTNTSEGRIGVYLCEGKSVLTLLPNDTSSSEPNTGISYVGVPAAVANCSTFQQQVPAEYKIHCETMDFMVNPLAEQIEAVLDERAYTNNMKIIALYVTGFLVLVGLFYAVLTKCVLPKSGQSTE